MSLDNLYEVAVKDFGYKNDKEHFGYHLGMQSVGHGVSWEDDADYELLRGFEKKKLTDAERKKLGSFGIETNEIELPRSEFY